MILSVSISQVVFGAAGIGFFVWELVSNFQAGKRDAESAGQRRIGKRYRSSSTSADRTAIE